MPMTLRDWIERFGGRCEPEDAPARVPLDALCAINAGRPRALAVLLDPRYRRHVAAFRGAAIAAAEHLDEAPCPVWVHPDPRALRRALALWLHPTPAAPRRHPSAVIDPDALVHKDATIEALAIIGPRAHIEAGARVGPGASVAHDAVVGPDAWIGPGARIGPRVLIGPRCRVGPNAVIGDRGFGYEPGPDGLVAIPHVGGVILDADVDIGAGSCVDAGTLEPTRVGAGTRVDNLVQIAHNVQIGRGCLILAQAGVAGSSVIEDGCILAGQVGVAGHLTVGAGSQIAAQSGVARSTPANSRQGGSPAYPLRQWQRSSLVAQALPARLKNLERRVDSLEEE